MREVGGHQHRVPGWEGARLAVAHTGVDHMGALTRAAAVTADCHIEGWRKRSSVLRFQPEKKPELLGKTA